MRGDVMYRCIFSDLDETLLVEHHVPVFNQEAIHSLKDKNIHFVPTTGRAFSMIQDILKELGTYQKADEYSICFNGGLIMENKDAKILHFEGLSFELTKEAFEMAAHYDVCVMVFTLECCYIFNADQDEVERKIIQKAHFEICDQYNMDFLKGQKIAKIIFAKKDMEYLKKIAKDQEALVKDRLSVSFSSNRYIEFNPVSVNKGAALKWLAHYLNIDISETIAIGDNYNDITMIQAAGLGVCVAGANQEIKVISDYVTTRDYDEGAVKEVIEKFV